MAEIAAEEMQEVHLINGDDPKTYLEHHVAVVTPPVIPFPDENRMLSFQVNKRTVQGLLQVFGQKRIMSEVRKSLLQLIESNTEAHQILAVPVHCFKRRQFCAHWGEKGRDMLFLVYQIINAESAVTLANFSSENKELFWKRRDDGRAYCLSPLFVEILRDLVKGIELLQTGEAVQASLDLSDIFICNKQPRVVTPPGSSRVGVNLELDNKGKGKEEASPSADQQFTVVRQKAKGKQSEGENEENLP